MINIHKTANKGTKFIFIIKNFIIITIIIIIIIIIIINPFTPKPAILSILLCLMPGDFTRQWGTPWGVNGLITHFDPFTPKLAIHILGILLCLTPYDFTRQWGTPRS